MAEATTTTKTTEPAVNQTPPAGAVKISNVAELNTLAKQGLTEKDLWRDPNGIDIYRLSSFSVQPANAANATDVADMAGAKDFINANQDSDISVASKGDEPPVRGSVTTMETLKETITGGQEAPAAPGYEQSYNALRTQYGIGDLESRLNSVTAEEEAVAAKYRYAVEDEEGKPVATNVIAGRQSEWEKQGQRELDAITRRKNSLNNQLTTAYGVVENLMKLKQMDYSAASDRYNQSFSQNIQLLNAAQGITDAEKTEAEREKDNARANLQIIQNSISSGEVTELSDDQKALVTKLELQAGLPVGFTASFHASNPNANIVTTKSWQAPDGTEYVSIISSDADGKLVTENIKVGVGRVPSSGGTTVQPTDADVLLYYKKGMKAAIEQGVDQNSGGPILGSDGFMSPENWAKARREWGTTTPYSVKEFDEQFRSYVNPAMLNQYAGFESEYPNE